MGQFKPMVKMDTTEPSVILHLKKGGHVARKEEQRPEHGHAPMRTHDVDEHFAMGGRAPKKPSMAERRRVMNPNFKDGGAAKFVDDIKTADRKDTVKGTGDVANGKPGGYKRGGKAKDGYAEGGAAKFLDDIKTADRKDTVKGTGGVKMGDGGYKRGGVAHKAEGGKARKEPGVGNAIEGNECKYTEDNVTDGDRKDTAHGTEGVKLGDGGYKRGGHAKKAYATGGKVDDGRAEKMPRHFVSQPVANSLQSGTFKRGGKVAKLAVGGVPPVPAGAVPAVPPPQGANDLAAYYDMLAQRQQDANNAGYAAATQRPMVTPDLVNRIKSALGIGYKHGGKAKR